jgi:hypothetical protein
MSTSNALRKSEPEVEPQANPITAFWVRCQARAYLWAACEYGLHEAVDDLQFSAEKTGLVAAIGQDHVQLLMSAGFKPYRPTKPDHVPACDICGSSPCMNRSFCRLCRQIDRKNQPVAPSNAPERGLAASTIAAFCHVVRQNDPALLRTWLAGRTRDERNTFRKMLAAK